MIFEHVDRTVGVPSKGASGRVTMPMSWSNHCSVGSKPHETSKNVAEKGLLTTEGSYGLL